MKQFAVGLVFSMLCTQCFSVENNNPQKLEKSLEESQTSLNAKSGLENVVKTEVEYNAFELEGGSLVYDGDAQAFGALCKLMGDLSQGFYTNESGRLVVGGSQIITDKLGTTSTSIELGLSGIKVHFKVKDFTGGFEEYSFQFGLVDGKPRAFVSAEDVNVLKGTRIKSKLGGQLVCGNELKNIARLARQKAIAKSKSTPQQQDVIIKDDPIN